MFMYPGHRFRTIRSSMTMTNMSLRTLKVTVLALKRIGFINTHQDRDGFSYNELADCGNEFDKYFNIDLLDADESVTEERNQFLNEMESCEVSYIDESL